MNDEHEWPMMRLGDVCDIVIGRTPSRRVDRYWNGDYPWITISDLNGSTVTNTREQITAEGAAETRSRLVPTGTLLFSFKLTIGKMAITGVDAYTNEAIAALTPKDPGTLDRDFLRFALLLVNARDAASHAVKGKTLNQTSLSSILIPLPPLNTQHRIVARLTEQMSVVNRACTALAAQLEATKALHATCLNEFMSFERGSWPRRRLGDLMTLRNEVVHPRNSPRGSARFVGLEHIESGTGVRTGTVELDMNQLTGRKPRFVKGDLVYGYLRPYLNKVWLAEFDGLCSVDQYVFRVDRDISDATYIAWFMRSPVFLRRAPIDATPGQLPRIRTDEVADVEIRLPPIAEQVEIARKIEEFHTSQTVLVAKIRAQLSDLLKLSHALPRDALAGKPELSLEIPLAGGPSFVAG